MKTRAKVTKRQQLDPEVANAGRVVKAWSKDLDDKGEHKPMSEQVGIEGKLPVGAYVLEAQSGALTARDLVLVTDASLVFKSSPKQALVLFLQRLIRCPDC